ncbi:hypothetical protein [Sphingobacterium cellulitidis]|uniref:hypothetical protein n=1 Tax=Sphingobacterium cellulitidis TaxID=1768011 RepID=UPI000B93E156|nr:hypothetical protein CHT99_10450 [Sphingobacterium cellulitidis]
MSDNKTIDNVHVHIYGHEMLGEVISRARKNKIPYDKEMQYDFHSHGHVYLVHQQGQLTLVEDPSENHNVEVSLNDLFELYLSKEEIESRHQIGKWYKHEYGSIFCVTSINESGSLYGYGFLKDGSWFSFIDESSSKCACNNIAKEYTTEATSTEVEQALIEEANRRGFTPYYDTFHFDHKLNILYDRFGLGQEVIFSNGKWATVIEQDKFAELKEAHRNGAIIESMPKKWIGDWTIATNPIWDGDNYEYRIKPEEKPKVGDVIKAWVDDENDYFIGVLDYINVNGDYVVKFQNSHDTSIYTFKARFAKTLTQQEAIELLFPNK